MEEARNQFAEQQKNVNVEQQRQNSTNIPMEPTVEDVERVRIRDQRVDDMVQFQTVPITNMIPKAYWKKEYRKRKLNELTTEEQEEQRKRNADRQRAYRERKLKQMEEARNQLAEQHVDDMAQFQEVPIANMIPNEDRQKEREEQKKRNVDR